MGFLPDRTPRPDAAPARQTGALMLRTAIVSTYAPRHCGIATFTTDLVRAVGRCEIVALQPPDQVEKNPPEVHRVIQRDDRMAHTDAARWVNRCGAGVVSIQHDYGIWGGDDDRHVLDFVGALDLPVVTTLHTVLSRPSAAQVDVMQGLLRETHATVVMSRAAAAAVTAIYGADPARVHIIPRGVPDLPFVDAEAHKSVVGVAGRRVLLSFGLLGPGKAYELMLEALPAIVKAAPTTRYVILGATHPELLRTEGEAYRNKLVALVRQLKLTDHVLFVDKFVGRLELGRWLEAADVLVIPRWAPDRIASGVLPYAMAAGRAVVSTPSADAIEMLADGRGDIVPDASPASLAKTITNLLEDHERRDLMSRAAYAHGRTMTWSQVGAEYAVLFARAAASATDPVAPRVAVRSA
jgi:glycosyltransferase involved in cell wall biosynthesis